MVMDRDDAIDKLGDLLKLDVDAARAYDEAIEKIDEEDIRLQLGKYRDDHHRHVSEITALINDMGGQAPEPDQDFKGKLIEGVTALRSGMGTDSALKAMRMNEQLTNRTYENAVEWAVSTEAHEFIRRGYEDERKHLAYIEQALSAGVGGRTGEY